MSARQRRPGTIGRIGTGQNRRSEREQSKLACYAEPQGGKARQGLISPKAGIILIDIGIALLPRYIWMTLTTGLDFPNRQISTDTIWTETAPVPAPSASPLIPKGTTIDATANPCNTSRDSSWYAGWAAGYPEAAKPPEDAIAGRAGTICAGASCVGVRGPWRVSLASRERSGQEGEESLLRGK